MEGRRSRDLTENQISDIVNQSDFEDVSDDENYFVNRDLENTDYCRRYNRQSRAYIEVSHPEVVKEYNRNMGGVDLVDRLMAVCPARAKTRKWTVRFISHFIDLVVTNSWINYKQDQLKKGILPHKIFI